MCHGESSWPHLMHACPHMAGSQPLQLLASLQQQAPRGYLDGQPSAVPQPDEEPREARLAVDGEEVEVIVEARDAGANPAILLQVATCSRAHARSMRQAEI